MGKKARIVPWKCGRLERERQCYSVCGSKITGDLVRRGKDFVFYSKYDGKH